jgi:hypothetical protein
MYAMVPRMTPDFVWGVIAPMEEGEGDEKEMGSGCVSLAIGGQRRRTEDLQGHVASEPLVAGTVNFAHAFRADLLRDSIVIEELACHAIGAR